MKLRARFDRPLFGPNGGRRYLWIQLEAPRRTAQTERAPLDVALVLDRSGSMGGAKIALAKKAASGAVQVLRETDTCALVAYDDVVETPVRAGRVDSDQRSLIGRALTAIDARGGTDLFGGWVAGAEQVSSVDAARVRRVLLLTDGLANHGLTDPAQIQNHVRELNRRGVGTTTFGVGADFDEYLLTGMAESGGGHFYFIEKPEQIPDFLASELGELAAIICRNVRLGVQVQGGAVLTCLNDIPMSDGRYELGDMSESAVVDVLFAVDIAPAAIGPLQLRVDVSWTDAETQAASGTADVLRLPQGSDKEVDAAAVDAETVRNVVRTRAAVVRYRSLDLNRKGQFREASASVKEALAELRELAASSPEAAEEVARLEALSEDLSAPVDALSRKQMAYDSYRTRRSRESW